MSIQATEKRDFQPVAAMTFGERVENTWSKSWRGLVDFVAGVLVAFVAVVPWALLALLIGLPALWILNRVYGRFFQPPLPQRPEA